MTKKISDNSIPGHLLDKQREAGWLTGVMAEVKSEMADGVSPEFDTGTDSLPPYYGSKKAPDGWSKGTYKKCAHTHPALKIEVAGKDTCYTVYGGACGDPVHVNLDIYVALDHSTSHDPQAWPWNGTRQFVYFPIQDMSVPKDPVEFRKMIDWLADQLVMGKSVHVGCLGGHGRTGLVLAALTRVLGGEEDAITYVRDHYCKKAVETVEQVNWLAKHFGIKKVSGSKTSYHGSTGWGDLAPAPKSSGTVTTIRPAKDQRAAALQREFGSNTVEVRPFKTAGNLWGVFAV